MAEGMPEKVAGVEGAFTWHYLKPMLERVTPDSGAKKTRISGIDQTTTIELIPRNAVHAGNQGGSTMVVQHKIDITKKWRFIEKLVLTAQSHLKN